MWLIYTVPQAHILIIERFGRFSRVQHEGLSFKIPIIERVKTVESWGVQANKEGRFIELAEQRTDTPIRLCHTKDNVRISVNASVYWRIHDGRKAVYEIENLPTTITDIALNALRANVGALTLDEVLAERQRLNDRIFTQLMDTTTKWGVQLVRVEIQELNTSDDTATAMRQEMTAERQKRALILEADGRKQSTVTIAEGQAKAIEIKAEAEAKALLRIAEAEAEYLGKLKEKLGSAEAAQVLISQKYINGMNEISQNPSDKVYLPNNFSGLFSLPTESKRNGN